MTLLTASPESLHTLQVLQSIHCHGERDARRASSSVMSVHDGWTTKNTDCNSKCLWGISVYWAQEKSGMSKVNYDMLHFISIIKQRVTIKAVIRALGYANSATGMDNKLWKANLSHCNLYTQGVLQWYPDDLQWISNRYIYFLQQLVSLN